GRRDRRQHLAEGARPPRRAPPSALLPDPQPPRGVPGRALAELRPRRPRLRSAPPAGGQPRQRSPRAAPPHRPEARMTPDELTQEILAAKKRKKRSWEKVAAGTGLSKMFVTAGCLGQMQLTEKAAHAVAETLGLGAEAVELLQEIPYRGSLPTTVPTDPLIY